MMKRPLSPPPVLSKRKPRSQTHKELPRAKTTVNKYCGICRLSHHQHLLAQCDKCHLWYHLGCLDPPLTRMPKKNSRIGWQCLWCVNTSSDGSEDVSPVNPPRRDKVKEPVRLYRDQADREFLFPGSSTNGNEMNTNGSMRSTNYDSGDSGAINEPTAIQNQVHTTIRNTPTAEGASKERDETAPSNAGETLNESFKSSFSRRPACEAANEAGLID